MPYAVHPKDFTLSMVLLSSLTAMPMLGDFVEPLPSKIQLLTMFPVAPFIRPNPFATTDAASCLTVNPSKVTLSA